MASKAIGFLNFKFGADLKGFDRAMKKAQKNLKKFGKNIERTGQNLTTGLTLPILGLGAASLKLASDFEETNAKFKTVFSSIQAEAEQTAKVFADSFGLSDLAAKQLLSDTGDLLVGFGFTEKSALDLSKQVNELAVDLASFTNFSGGAEGASAALTKALLGERESIKSLGIAITETDLKKFAAEHGLVWKELDRVAKAQLTFDLALKQSSKAVGDFERTQDGFANQMRITKGELTDAAISLGEHLLPMAQKAIAVVRGLIEKFNSLSVSTKENIVKWGLIVAAIGPALIIFGKMVVGVSGLIKLFAALRTAVLATSGAFKALTVAMVKNPIGALIAVVTTAAASYLLLETNTKKASRAQKEFNGVTESTEDAIKRLSKSVGDMGKDSIQLQIEEIEALIKKIKGFEVKESQFTKGIGLSKEQQQQLKDLNNILFELQRKQALAKIEADDLAKSMGNLGEKTGETGKKVKKTYETLSLTPQMPSLDTPSQPEFSLAEQFDVPETIFEKMDRLIGKTKEVMQLGTYSEEVWKQTMQSVGNELAGGAKSFEEYGKVIKGVLKDAIGGLISKGVAAAVSNSLSNPALAINPFMIPVIAGAAAGLARTALNSLIPEFAQGGLVTGPTVGLIGEGIGTTASNPEVIAPLDKLKQFIGGGSQNVIVEGVIKGNDIFLSNRNTGTNRQRSV
jgi:hypothetical protein